MTQKYYIAHGFVPPSFRRHVKDEVQPALDAVGVSTVNPFDGRIWAQEEYYIDRDNPLYHEVLDNDPNERPNVVVKRDLDNIDDCDGLIAYASAISIGTSMELFYNSFMKGRGKNKSIFVYTDDLPETELKCLEHFATLVDGRSKTLHQLALEISDVIFYENGDHPQLPPGIDSKAPIEITTPTVLDSIRIIYNSKALDRGPEGTPVILKDSRYAAHPWLNYFSEITHEDSYVIE
ncbi:MAG: hypothetical protein GOV00_00895 [Candidatus Altiarchaeota archaeon]|nr:hypothetical protein [Candidatus Altiarchaeota archaeon]